MFKPEKLGLQNQAFLRIASALSAVIHCGVAWGLVTHYELSQDFYRTLTLLLLLALVAYTSFYSFQLMISARSTLWMLGQGLRRWLRVLLCGLLLFLFFLHDEASPDDLRALVTQWVAVVLPLQLLLLAALRRAALKINNAPSNRRQAVFIGLGPEALKLAKRLSRSPILGIDLQGYFAPTPQPLMSAEGTAELRHLGTYADAVRSVREDRFAVVFVTMHEVEDTHEFRRVVEQLYDSTAAIYFLPELRVAEGFSIQSAEMAGVPLLALHETTILGASRYLKRFMDILLAGAGIVALSPLMLLIALAIRLDSPGPILYRQKRYGERGRPITIFKFRSMRQDAPQDGLLEQARPGDARVTRVGRLLRRFSLDELPQLFNVLNGSMSLVGPRPHAASHNEYYRHLIRGYMLRHTVKPGITGWAQVNGLRGETDTLEKMRRRVEYDRYYITHWSIWLDIRILFKTVFRVLWDRKAY